MEDHETLGAEEWYLPGYGHVKTVIPSTSTVVPPPVTTTDTPHGNPEPVSRAEKYQKTPGAHREETHSWRPSNHEDVGTIHSCEGSPERITFREIRLDFRGTLRPKRIGDLDLNQQVESIISVFGALKREFFEVGKEVLSGYNAGNRGRLEVFDALAKKTGAYVKPPSYNDKVIKLWGEPAQVSAAQELLQELIIRGNALAYQKKRSDWAKIYAHSMTKEENIARKEEHENIIQQLRRAPDASMSFPEKLLFLWPTDELSIKELLGPQLEAFDPIRREFRAHLYLSPDLPDYICVAGYERDIIREIVHLIRVKWNELMASTNIKSKLYVVEPPEPDFMRGRISIKTNHHQLAKPILDGGLLKGAQLADWDGRATLIRSKNDIRVLGATEQALKGLAFFRGYLQMRVNFGTFVLDEYRLAKDGRTGYSFETFREMLLYEKTRGRLLPGLQLTLKELGVRFNCATPLLEPLAPTSESLENIEPAYSVNFEFGGRENELLRLEAEFTRRPGAQEYEVTQRRWVKPHWSGQYGIRRSPLQIAVIDFGRADWQLEIKALQLHDTINVNAALRSFPHAIGFRSGVASERITDDIKRRVIFPESAPISRIIEKAAIRFRLKGTDYILEVARFDEYTRNGLQIRDGRVQCPNPTAISEVPKTTWGASIFGVHWDNLLGQHANMEVGHVASWKRDLDTFFPKNEKGASSGDHPGFQQFILQVKDIAALLGPDMQLVHRNSQSKASNDGIPKIEYKPTGIGIPPKDVEIPTDEQPETTRLLDAELGTLF
ncbi:hypothetical protein Egran_03978 [Elaphomyces granulatus]|uniref:DUF7905 domain-containing protein n=1 Tax=Elaphomyces granulatus TaxID=519963 RepID=A0A232LVX4_9EURO|nr:hypothetical protein Egran_03978 [Elaphomyces granulatus]